MAVAVANGPDGSIRLVLVVLGTAVLGWAGVIVFHAALMAMPEQAAWVDEQGMLGLLSICGTAPDISGPGVGNWLVGWALMVVAMMLPPALPLMRASQRLFQGRSDGLLLLLLVPLAFLLVWMLAGLCLLAVGSAGRAGLRLLPLAAERPQIAAAIAAVAAGLFQFTSLKMSCMDACRSPTSVMMTGWQGARPRLSALRIGARYGVICVGCCWAMMILSVLVGALMLPIMVVTALMMTLERMLPVFRPLIPLQAAFAILVGALLLAGALPPAFF
ncbi:DUF2182 domain-containing protein [Rhizobium sp. SG2393]|uniref:DUF2182 domain-containing protein n=1 Tax=Rhizobium sp. SG2393 TaxID=3276279 RepID=UPI00366E55EE